MKKKSIIIIMSAVIVASSLLSACSLISPIDAPAATDGNSSPSADADSRIKELEAKLVALMQDQQQSESENQKEINALKAEIEALKKEADEEKESEDSADKESEKPKSNFKYTLSGGLAVITAVTCDEENIVIPSTIDGYRVYAVGSEACSSDKVKSITVSPGIEKLDWFAFKNCPSLSSVSLPDSISSIGYGAFDNSSPSLIIRCTRDSFAHRYAQSYGFTYDIT